MIFDEKPKKSKIQILIKFNRGSDEIATTQSISNYLQDTLVELVLFCLSLPLLLPQSSAGPFTAKNNNDDDALVELNKQWSTYNK